MTDKDDEQRINRFKDAIYWRGMLVQRYAAVEWSITKLLWDVRFHDAYRRLPEPSYQLERKVAQLRKVVSMPGPLMVYGEDLSKHLNEFRRWEQYRHFMVHGFMVPNANGQSALFQMFEHRKPKQFGLSEIVLTIEQLKTFANEFQPLSSAFTEVTACICRELAGGTPS